ncbi:hypothetical protein PV325_005981 [Microctonus aethiopoides]|nr:hypothetical protein PV325_005981 [Microctonus aethiopoides]KAK0096304.1 hypothetical protein PV326_005854 [Microctonus aethiopoides]
MIKREEPITNKHGPSSSIACSVCVCDAAEMCRELNRQNFSWSHADDVHDDDDDDGGNEDNDYDHPNMYDDIRILIPVNSTRFN